MEENMTKAIGSKINVLDYEDLIATDYRECIEDLLELDEVKQLGDFVQHCHTSRFQHCINVSYYSYLVCKVMGFDYRSAARGGLLHDLFLYDWHIEKTPQKHAFWHPKAALKTAEAICNLNKIEKDIIVKHMWPVTLRFPRYSESYVITFVDKYCACVEVVAYFSKLTKAKVLHSLFGTA
jgi:uncharacterized protein